MLTLSQLFTNLSYNELSNFSVGEDGTGHIPEIARPRITNYVNQGLKRIYSRFVLKELDVLIMMHDYITNYHLIPRFAVQYVPVNAPHDDEPVRYILDLPNETFKGDVLKILSVFDSDDCKLSLNDDESLFGVFTPQADILQVPNPVSGKALNVLYQARHVPILGELEEQIVIPDILEEALTAFVAYKVCDHMNTAEMSAKAQDHLTVYETVCQQATDKDLVNSSRTTTSAKFANRGWV